MFTRAQLLPSRREAPHDEDRAAATEVVLCTSTRDLGTP